MDRDARLVDAHGQRHTRAAQGARIVSLVPSITELLFDMDLGAQVVGRTGFCIHPREALRSTAQVTRATAVMASSSAAFSDIEWARAESTIDEAMAPGPESSGMPTGMRPTSPHFQ